MKSQVRFLDLQSLTAELRGPLDAAWRRVADSGWFILGPELEAFESEFAAYCGTQHCVGVGSGLDALRLILEASGVGAGDEVLVPAHTFIATWLAVSALGATPVPVDVREGSYLMDLDLVSSLITARSRAIIGVHLYGEPLAMEPLAAIAERHGLLLVEDAAQAHGAATGQKRTGALGHAAAFSFYPAKNLGALGDGGAITTDDGDLAERLRMLRNYGSKEKYDHSVVGTNSRLDELQAAFLREKLRYLDRWNERRRTIAEHYAAGLANTPLGLPLQEEGVRHAWHLYVVRTRNRDQFKTALADRGVQTQIHYPVPPHCTGAFAELQLAARPLLTESLCQEILSLPMDPSLSHEGVEAVIHAAREAVWEVAP